MYCMKCGTQLPDDAKFCFSCGVALSSQVEESGNQDSRAFNQDHFVSTRKKSKNKKQKKNAVSLQQIRETEPTISYKSKGRTFSLANRFTIHFTEEEVESINLSASLIHIAEKQAALYSIKSREPYTFWGDFEKSFRGFVAKCIDYCRPAFSFCEKELINHKIFSASALEFEESVRKIDNNEFIIDILGVKEEKNTERENTVNEILNDYIYYGIKLIKIICINITFYIYEEKSGKTNYGGRLLRDNEQRRLITQCVKIRADKIEAERRSYRECRNIIRYYEEGRCTAAEAIKRISLFLKKPLVMTESDSASMIIDNIIDVLKFENIPLGDSFYREDLFSLYKFLGDSTWAEVCLSYYCNKERSESVSAQYSQWLTQKIKDEDDEEKNTLGEKFIKWIEEQNLSEKDKNNLLLLYQNDKSKFELDSRNYILFAIWHIISSQEVLNNVLDYWIDDKRYEIGFLWWDINPENGGDEDREAIKKFSLPFLPLFFTDGKYKLPLKSKHMSLFGIGDDVEFIIDSEEYIDWESRDITFYNIKFNREYEEVIEKRKQHAEELLQQGIAYEKGIDDTKDLQMAVNYYAKADSLGSEEGAVNLCNLLMQGIRPDNFEEEDVEKFVRDKLESTDCDKCKVLIASILAPLYEEGKGGCKEMGKAIDCCKIICESGDMAVLPHLCELCRKVEAGVDSTLIPFVSQLADNGDVNAIATLARSVDDDSKKEFYYKKAINLDPDTEDLKRSLSILYMNIAKQADNKEDYDEAEKYFKLASDLGNKDAASEIALLYAKRGLTSVANKLCDIFGSDNDKKDNDKKDNNCFITTAVCSSLNKPDDCDELMTMRWYRDKLKSEDPDMKELIKEYYRTAPGIVKKIDCEPGASDIYRGLWDNSISKIYRSLKQAEYRDATLRYIDMFEKLCGKFDTQLSPDIKKRIQAVRQRN